MSGGRVIDNPGEPMEKRGMTTAEIQERPPPLSRWQKTVGNGPADGPN